MASISDAGIPLVAQILPEATAAAPNAAEAFDRFDPHHVFRHLVAELPLDAEPQRRAVGDGKRPVVHLVGEDRLLVEGVFEPDRFVIAIGLRAGLSQHVGAMEHHVARIWLEPRAVEHGAEADALPLADAAPALDTIVTRDLGARRHGAKLGE